MNILAVPIRVDALVATKEESVVGPSADFSRLPYQSPQGYDVNADRGFIASSVAKKAFNNVSHLSPGIHLHWALPDALTKGKAQGKQLTLPAVPDRWLVRRLEQHDGQPHCTASWVIESNYLYPQGVTPERAVCIPNRDNPHSNGQPFCYLGRQLSLSQWQQEQRLGLKHDYLANLNGLGWGNPYFSALYSECFSVFGAFDSAPVPEDSAGFSYEVLGWYSQSDSDFIHRYLQGEAGDSSDLAHRAKRLANWQLPQDATAQHMLCYGKVAFAETLAFNDGIDISDTRICLAKTSNEAVASYLAKALGATPEDALRIENQLQAALFREALDGENIDFINQLKVARHKEGFSPLTSGVLWGFADFTSLIQADSLNNDDKQQLKSWYQAFTQQHQGPLTQLNQDQEQLNLGLADIQSLRSQVYADWSKYIQALYPALTEDTPGIDSDVIQHLLQHSSLPKLKALTDFVTGLQTGVEGQKQQLQSLFEQARQQAQIDAKAFARGCLLRLPGPRYWQANDPALLIAGDVAKPSPRYGFDAELPCQILTVASVEESSLVALLLSGRVASSITWAEQGVNHWQRQPWNPLCLEWSLDLIDFKPQLHSVTANNKNYVPDHIVDNYHIPLNDAEFALPSTAVDLQLTPGRSMGMEENANVVRGRSLLTHTVKGAVLERLQEALDAASAHPRLGDEQQGESSAEATVHNAHQVLSSQHCLTQRLDGYHDELLMQSRLSALRIADPLQFIDPELSQKGFSAQVNELLDNQFYKLPSLGHEFTPIKTGITRLGMLRIVDSFGRFKDLDCHETLRPQRELIGSAVFSPPRVLQPSRLKFRWRDHFDAARQQHTPICGWFCYNLFNDTLVCFSSGGDELGHINSDGEWLSPLGVMQDLSGVSNATMADFIRKLLSFHSRNRIIQAHFLAQEGASSELWQALQSHGILQPDASGDWALWLPTNPEHWPREIGLSFSRAQTLLLAAKAHENYWPALLRTLRSAQSNIEPGYSQHRAGINALSPLALVQAELDLQLYGQPQRSKSWDALALEIATGDRASRRFEQVKFPIKLGEFNNLDDGLVAYWGQTSEGELSGTGVFPNADSEDIRGWIDAANFNSSDRNYVDDGKTEGVANLSQSFSDPALPLLMLMDPEAVVHATTGILPKKSLRLPASLYADTLAKLQVAYFAAPLLIPKAQLAIPLNNKDVWLWQRVTGRDTEGHMTLQQQFSVQVSNKTQFLALGGNGDDWQQLLQNKVLTPVPDTVVEGADDRDNLAYFVAPDSEDLPESFRSRWQQIQPWLAKSTRSGIAKPENIPPLTFANEVVEGWLRVVPDSAS